MRPRTTASICSVFFFNDTATTEIYTLSLHDALPISDRRGGDPSQARTRGTAGAGFRRHAADPGGQAAGPSDAEEDRKSTRLNSSHSQISYAVFCLKKKKKQRPTDQARKPRHHAQEQR